MKRALYIFLLLVVGVACSEDIEDVVAGGSTSAEGDEAISFSVSTTPLSRTSSRGNLNAKGLVSISSSPLTRVDIVDDIVELQESSFSLYGYHSKQGYLFPEYFESQYKDDLWSRLFDDNFEVTYDSQSGTWIFPEGESATWYFEEGNISDRYSFFGIWPYVDGESDVWGDSTISLEENGAFLDYVLPEDIDDQFDLMVTSNMNLLRPAGGIVDLNFTHALSAIQLRVDGRDDVANITFSGYAKEGQIDLMSGQWTADPTGSGSYVSTEITGTKIVDNSSEVTYTKDLQTWTSEENGYILMIPQEVCVPYTFTGTDSGETYTEYTSPDYNDIVITIESDESRLGYAYTIELNLGDCIDQEFTLEPGVLYTLVYTAAWLSVLDENDDDDDDTVSATIDLDNYDATLGTLDDAKEVVQGLVDELEAYEVKELTFTGTYNQYLLEAFSDAGYVLTYDLSQMDYDGSYYFDSDGNIGGTISTKIHSTIFAGDTCVQTIIMPEGLAEIVSGAFAGCTNLEEVIFSEGTTLAKISDSVFEGCTSLKTFDIPSTVTEINESAFEGCTSLTSVTFSNGSSLGSISNYAFMGCTSLTSFLVPSSLKTLKSGVFYGCTSLKYLTNQTGFAFEDNSILSSVGGYAFGNSGISSSDLESAFEYQSGNTSTEYDSVSITSTAFTKSTSSPYNDYN